MHAQAAPESARLTKTWTGASSLTVRVAAAAMAALSGLAVKSLSGR